MEEKELMQLILGLKTDPHRKSTLQLALEVARRICNVGKDGKIREIDFNFRNNIVEDIMEERPPKITSDEADIFTSLLIYLNCLEQIGILFCERNKVNPIKKAINNFSSESLSSEKVNVLKNLRNSLAHNFGLVNVNPKNKPLNKFLLIFEHNDEIVKLPNKKWNGEYTVKSEETSTVIYTYSVIELVEQIIAKLQNCCVNEEVDFSIDIEEVKSRFTVLS